jgi:hypothetical protein
MGAAILLHVSNANAIGVFYADPVWAYAFDGKDAYYHDPDGPNPDYINGNDQNQPGGQGGQPALVNPSTGGIQWIGVGQWDGTKPGDSLGGVPMGIPPLPPPSPGGVGAYIDGTGVTFVRIQDAGNPQSYGWADKGEQAGPTTPRQEGNNRRLLFGHEIAKDAEFSGSTAVIDNGITISFRARLATAATGPLDNMFPEGGTSLANTIQWPEDGLGYDVHTGARGMFMISQTTATGAQSQMGFSILDDDTVTVEGLEGNVGSKRGLVMNSRAASAAGGTPETNEATPTTANVFEIPDQQLDDWQEFWITVQRLAVQFDGNTHEVKVYHNGSVTPQTFQIVLALENEFRSSAFLGMGLSSDTRQGAFDVDFFAYKEGVVAPTLNPIGIAGDYNDDGRVDAADYVVWRNGGPLLNETETISSITAEDYDIWRTSFGVGASSAVELHAGRIPEPSSVILLIASPIFLTIARRRTRSLGCQARARMRPLIAE